MTAGIKANKFNTHLTDVAPEKPMLPFGNPQMHSFSVCTLIRIRSWKIRFTLTIES